MDYKQLREALTTALAAKLPQCIEEVVREVVRLPVTAKAPPGAPLTTPEEPVTFDEERVVAFLQSAWALDDERAEMVRQFARGVRRSERAACIAQCEAVHQRAAQWVPQRQPDAVISRDWTNYAVGAGACVRVLRGEPEGG